MIALLPKEQIDTWWEYLLPGIEESLPPANIITEARRTAIKKALNSGSIQAWILHKDDGSKEPCGIILTTVIIDIGTGALNLLIYALRIYKTVNNKVFVAGVKTLKEYAKSQGCSFMVAYTNNSNVKSVSEKLGGKTDVTYVMFSVGG